MRRDPIDDVVDHMEKLFNEFHDVGKDIAGRSGGVPVDVSEEDGHVILRADLPGVAKEDISLKADSDSVEITAEASTEVEEQNEKYFRKERKARSFRRKIRWPTEIDPDTIEAEFESGVLTVSAETEVSEGRDIEIE